VILALLCGCSAASYANDADAEVAEILGEADRAVLGNRESWIIQPKPSEPEAKEPAPLEPKEPGPPPVAAPSPPPVAETYDLAKALATAVTQNREYLARKESLYRQGLSHSLAKFDYGPRFNSTVAYVWSDQEDSPGSQRSAATLSVSQILPTGGTLALTSSVDGLWPYGGGANDPTYGSSVGAALTQPLLRGAGYEVSHEALTAADRELVYAIRDFELYRESFSIGIARTFFDLVSQRKTLANEDANYQRAVFDRGKAEALFNVGRNKDQEVFRARRREIEAKSQLINARAAYDQALDEFKIQLGLPTSALLDIAETEPPYEPVRIDQASAIAAARHNRLDLINEQQRLEDAERALRIAENGLLPALDLVATTGLAGTGDSPGDAGPSDWNSSVGLTFQVPLQQKSERNTYRSAMISLEQARRDFTLRQDQLDLGIRESLRNLKNAEEQIELQIEQIQHEQRAVTVTEIRYEAGTLENRDLLEARQALVDAQNALIRLKAGHFILRLNLLRDLGVFFIDGKGMWR
jgi:outer membrane protein TolC